MAYEYEKENIRKLKSYNVLSGGANITKPIKELQEVYRKARAFDEVLNIDLAQHDEEYADNVMKVVNKFTEDKQND